jgi:hypothetical protein
MHTRLLIAAAAAVAVVAGLAALQTEPATAPRIVATEPMAPQMVEIGGEIIPSEPGSGLVIIEHGIEPDAGPIGALVRVP